MWLLTEQLGWTSEVFANRDEPIWPPLRDSSFARVCRSSDDELQTPDVIFAIKPIADSVTPARLLSRRFRVPLLVDIDDPDVQSQFGEGRRLQVRKFAGRLLRRQPLDLRDRLAAWRATRHANTVSNPALLRWYPGATIIPHVRLPRSMPAHVSRQAVVAFVGTPRHHKGLSLLRSAVAEANMRLVITADRPADAKLNERWVGQTSLVEGLGIVEASDIVALPSLDGAWGRSQFPVKVLDAMMAGRAIIASDVPPLRWATGGGAVLVTPGDGTALLDSLRLLAESSVRQRLGERAHDEAMTRFTPAAVARSFQEVVEGVVGG